MLQPVAGLDETLRGEVACGGGSLVLVTLTDDEVTLTLARGAEKVDLQADRAAVSALRG